MKRKMSTTDFELVAGIVILVISVVGIVTVLRLASMGKGMETPRFMPLVFLSSAALLSLLLVILKFLQKGRPVRSGMWAQMWKNEGFWRVLLAVGFVAVYIYVLIPLVGFYLGSLIFVFGAIVFYGSRTSVYKVAMIAVGTVVALYMIFAMLFKLPFR